MKRFLKIMLFLIISLTFSSLICAHGDDSQPLECPSECVYESADDGIIGNEKWSWCPCNYFDNPHHCEIKWVHIYGRKVGYTEWLLKRTIDYKRTWFDEEEQLWKSHTNHQLAAGVEESNQEEGIAYEYTFTCEDENYIESILLEEPDCKVKIEGRKWCCWEGGIEVECYLFAGLCFDGNK